MISLVLDQSPDRTKIIVPGPPVPYVRMTRASMWTTAAKNYLGYKQYLKEQIEKACPDWLVGPGPEDKKERTKWLKLQDRYYFRVGIDAYVESRKRGDLDNLLKTCMDGLQYATVFHNDSLVEEILPSRKFEDRTNPRLEITLERVMR